MCIGRRARSFQSSVLVSVKNAKKPPFFGGLPSRVLLLNGLLECYKRYLSYLAKVFIEPFHVKLHIRRKKDRPAGGKSGIVLIRDSSTGTESKKNTFLLRGLRMDLMKHFANAAKIFPRFGTIFPNEKGVFLRMGRYKRSLEPGLYFCFPIIDEIQKLDVTPQVINLPNQSVTTKDSKALAISGTVEYSISNPRKALLEVQNFDASLQNLSMGVIANYVKGRSYQDCIKLNGLEQEIVKEIKNKACEWGLEVTTFWVTDLAEHKVYRLMTQDTPTAVIPEDSDYD